jgi:hypothetical protein
VLGDIPALCQQIIYNRSDKDNDTSAPKLAFNRLIVGLRSVDRGDSFSAYINCGNNQVPPGFILTAGTNTTFGNSYLSPVGNMATYNPGGAEAVATRLTISVSSSLARHYFGRYHMYLRGMQSGGTNGDISVRAQISTGSGGILYTTASKTFDTAANSQLIDLGLVEIPASDLFSENENADATNILIQASSLSGTPNLYLYDIILIPIDEWAGDFGVTTLSMNTNGVGAGKALKIDSLVNLHKNIRGVAVLQADTNYIYSIYRSITNGDAILQPNKRQKLWFLAIRDNISYQISYKETVSTVRIWSVNRYLSMRGDS